MLDHLLIVPHGGLCNRIGVIASARRLCEINRIRCTVLWDWGDYHSLFARDTGVDSASTCAVDTSSLHMIKHLRPAEGGNPSNWRVPISTHKIILLESSYVFCATEESTNIAPRDLRRWLPKPTDLILSKVASFKNQHFSKTVGMHIRRTDHKPATEGTPDDVCINVARQVIQRGYSIFLATDNYETEQMMRTHFGENIIIYPKNNSLKIRWPRPQFVFKETVDDLVDLHLLAVCEHVLGSMRSTYSLMAMLYNGSAACRWMANPIGIKKPVDGANKL